nr:MAG TPA: Fatty acid synthase type I helical domain protein [Caudoviricetes sp.]
MLSWLVCLMFGRKKARLYRSWRAWLVFWN